MLKIKTIAKYLILLNLFFVSLSFSAQANLDINHPAPPFQIVSGTDQLLTSDMIKNKIVVLFYETRGSTQKNRKVKDELNKLYFSLDNSDKSRVIRLPVINCSRVTWLKPAYKQGLNRYSQIEGMTIYGDWTGGMLRDYQVADLDSNLMIIDQDGIIRFSQSGQISPQEIPPIKQLVINLLHKEY